MSCLIPEKIESILNSVQCEAKMQEYGVTADTLTESDKFITEYLQPLLEEVADNIADESGRTEDWQKSRVSVVLFDPDDPKKQFSSHDHKTNEIVICWDVKQGTLRDQCRKLANDIRHESEHANQTDGDGYSIDQRTLSKLSRISYHTGSDALYYNNFNEIRARLAEFKMHYEIYTQMVQQNAPFEQRQQAVQNLAAAESHLTHHLSQTGQEQWMARAQKDIQRMILHTNSIRAAFPEAHSTREAKQMAVTFLQQKAPEIFEELRTEIKAYSDKVSEIMLSFESERKQVQKQEAQREVLAHEKAKDMPMLTVMPVPKPNYCFQFTDVSAVDIIMSGDTITLYNRALVQQNGELYLVGDTSEIYRDYAHPRPAGLTPEAAQPEQQTEGFIDFNTLFQSEETPEEEIGDEEPGWGD